MSEETKAGPGRFLTFADVDGSYEEAMKAKKAGGGGLITFDDIEGNDLPRRIRRICAERAERQRFWQHAHEIARYSLQMDALIARYAHKPGPGQQSFNWSPEDAAKHPRTPKGGEHGGRFAEKPKAAEPAAPTTKEPTPAKTLTAGGVTFARAPVGGAVSPVNGIHYIGGRWMPIHGDYAGLLKQKAEKKEQREARKVEAEKRKKESENRWKERQTLTPEQLAEHHARKEAEKQWTEVRNGSIGELLPMGERPHKLKRTQPGTKKQWEPFADAIGPSGTEAIVKHLEPLVHDELRREAAKGGHSDWKETPDEMIAWSIGDLKQRAEDDKKYHTKKHVKANPQSTYAAVLFAEYMEHANLDEMHELGKFLDSLKPPKAHHSMATRVRYAMRDRARLVSLQTEIRKALG